MLQFYIQQQSALPLTLKLLSSRTSPSQTPRNILRKLLTIDSESNSMAMRERTEISNKQLTDNIMTETQLLTNKVG